jgi:hypothetical protein
MTSDAQQSRPTATVSYRQYLPDLDTSRFQVMQQQDAHEYATAFKEGRNPPWLHALYLHWRQLFDEPFTGITNDGGP